MQIPYEDLLKALLAECYAKRNFIFIIFTIISLTTLYFGANWPKIYTTFTIIHVDDTNILKSLMRGTVETTQTVDHVANAREIIFGEIIMNGILKDAGWLESNPSDIKQERIKLGIKKRIAIKTVAKGLLRIEYRDIEPERAFITVKRLAELFISEGEKAKSKESNTAFKFIDRQVTEYLNKLTKVETNLRDFRSNNPDARSGLQAEVSKRITRLQRTLEQAQLDLREAKIRRKSLDKQLSGEAVITISSSREGQFQTKIATLQEKLESLQLDYKDTYPDIVRIKAQIEALKRSLSAEVQKRDEAKKNARIEGKSYIDQGILLSPLYQELRSNAATTETKIVTLKARINDMNNMLKTEFSRAKRINDGEAELSQLTRDYDVNKGIYQDLLKRRENARVSQSLDMANTSLSYEIQEPAKLPLIPTGLRFLHFVIAGLVSGLMVPVGLIFLLLQFDPRIRFSQVLTEELNVPVLTEIQTMNSYSELRSSKINLVLITIGLLIVFSIYGYVGWFKLVGNVS